MSPRLIGGVIDTSAIVDDVQTDPRIDRLEAQIDDLKADLAAAQREKQHAVRALTTLRQRLSPLYTALQLVFGDLDAAGVPETAAAVSGASPAPVDGPPRKDAAIWASWKEKLGPSCARIIDVLLLHGDLNIQQIAMAAHMHRKTASNNIGIMDNRGIRAHIAVEDVVAFYSRGATLRAIGVHYGVSFQRIQQILRRSGITRKERASRAMAVIPSPPFIYETPYTRADALHDRLQRYYVENQLTQTELGQRLEMEQAHVSRVLGTTRVSDINFYDKCARLFGLSLAELIRELDDDVAHRPGPIDERLDAMQRELLEMGGHEEWVTTAADARLTIIALQEQLTMLRGHRRPTRRKRRSRQAITPTPEDTQKPDVHD
jgi:transcriptional regulator with XRE-family HTH domain